MTKKDADFEAKKHDMSVRSMYFSRYLMIRYFSAAFVFANLFWLIFAVCYQDIIAIILSGVLFVLLIAGSVEQASKWHRKDTDLKITTFYYGLQLIANIFLAVVCYLPIGKVFFPFMTNTDVANIIFTILIVGVLGCILVLRRIKNIQNGRDRYLRAIKTFENNKQ